MWACGAGGEIKVTWTGGAWKGGPSAELPGLYLMGFHEDPLKGESPAKCKGIVQPGYKLSVSNQTITAVPPFQWPSAKLVFLELPYRMRDACIVKVWACAKTTKPLLAC